jgi:hypothetical protein
MDVVRSTYVQRWHLQGVPPILIELELADETTGATRGFACALLSPALAEELGVRLQMLAASDLLNPPTTDEVATARLQALSSSVGS